MADQETAHQIVHSFLPIQILYTDAGTSAHLINKIAAALTEARREERERCAETCEMKLINDTDRQYVVREASRQRAEIERRVEIKTEEANRYLVERDAARAEVERLREAARDALRAMESATVFIQSREHIKKPEGHEWWAKKMQALRAALGGEGE